MRQNLYPVILKKEYIISSDSKKRVYKWNTRLNGSMNNLTNNMNNNNNNNYNNNVVNVNIINKNIPIQRNNNRGGSIKNNIKYNPMNLKKDVYGTNLTNDYSPSLNIEKFNPSRTGRNFNNIKNGKKHK